MKNLIKAVFYALILVSCIVGISSCVNRTADNTGADTDAATWYESMEWLDGVQLIPSESVNQQEFEKLYKADQEWWALTFEFLRSHDLDTLEPGRYVIDTGNVTASISVAAANEIDQVKWEAHRNFSDLQYIISGKATMGVAPIAEATIVEEYNPQSDIAFYDVEGQYYTAEPGTFFIFTPQDVHRPAIKVEGSDTIKRMVIKIRASQLVE
jgi:YhcH/YjgK/YiaL family protein